MSVTVTFVPVNESHRPLLRQWLSQPHALAWWGPVEEELALIYDGKGEHEPYIACVDGRPIAYVQAWWPSKHPDLPWQHGMAATTRGIDIIIGKEENLNKGFGTNIIKAFSERLFTQGATRLIIDPDSTNTRAIAANTKAGFNAYGSHTAGNVTDILMEMLPRA